MTSIRVGCAGRCRGSSFPTRANYWSAATRLETMPRRFGKQRQRRDCGAEPPSGRIRSARRIADWRAMERWWTMAQSQMRAAVAALLVAGGCIVPDDELDDLITLYERFAANRARLAAIDLG